MDVSISSSENSRSVTWLVRLSVSDRPDSAHYADQAASVFSERRLRPSWWRPEELADHITSRTVLDSAP